MKILYVTDHMKIAQSGGFINDYQNDLLFYGLYELFGSDVVDSVPIVSLYQQNKSKIDKRVVWGGFTSLWLIEKDTVDRRDIKRKIKDKFFDLIIYGSIRRCSDFYSIASKAYPPGKIIFVDGDDDQVILSGSKKHLYFKRELYNKQPNVLPISFGIPTCKVTQHPGKNKSKRLAQVIPGIQSTYTFEKEDDYYQDYNNSFFAITTKKSGWDCMRHYEILANYCLPYFIDIQSCPEFTLYNFPKKQVANVARLFNEPNINLDNYFNLADELFDYTRSHLTTKNIAQRLLEQVV